MCDRVQLIFVGLLRTGIMCEAREGTCLFVYKRPVWFFCLALLKHAEMSNNVHGALLQGRSRMGDAAFPSVNKLCGQRAQLLLTHPSNPARSGSLHVCVYESLEATVALWTPVSRYSGLGERCSASAMQRFLLKKMQFGHETSDQSPWESSPKGCCPADAHALLSVPRQC